MNGTPGIAVMDYDDFKEDTLTSICFNYNFSIEADHFEIYLYQEMTKITCIQLEISIIAYELGMSLSMKFWVAFIIFQYEVLATVTKIVTMNQEWKRKTRGAYLCVVLNAFALFTLMTILITEKMRLIALLLLYYILVNVIAIYYSYKSHKIPTQLNSGTENDESVKNHKWINMKKDSRMINKAVILTAISSGIKRY